MTRAAQAASAAGRDNKAAIVHTHDTPHPTDAVGCPACRTGDQLYLIERVVIHRPIVSAITTLGLTAPELTMDGYHEDGAIVAEIEPVLLGVGCLNCRWSFEGNNPVHKLVAL